jgi:hypothetical protein
MKKLIANKWKTPDGTILWSKHRHDYVCHLDLNGEYYFVDGGNEYVRMSVNKEKLINLCEYDNGTFECHRNNVCWGRNYDSNLKLLPQTEYIPIKDLTDDHIWAILTTQRDMHSSYRKLMEEELIYRENQII